MKRILLVVFVLVFCLQNLMADDSSKLSKADATASYSIQVLLKAYAEKNNTTIIVDPSAKAAVRIFGKSPTDITESDLHSILHVHGLSMVKVGTLYVVKPTAFAKQNGISLVQNTDQPFHGSQLVTTIISPKHIAAANLVPILRPLIAKEAHFAAFGPSNKLVLTDTYDNVKRITDIITVLDAEMIGANSQPSIKK